jgi:hypothetical protein
VGNLDTVGTITGAVSSGVNASPSAAKRLCNRVDRDGKGISEHTALLSGHNVFSCGVEDDEHQRSPPSMAAATGYPYRGEDGNLPGIKITPASAESKWTCDDP